MVLPETLPDGQPPVPAAPAADDWRRFRVRLIGAGVVVAVLFGVVKFGLGIFGGSSYTFLEMQGDNPVTWDHCHAIPYQVNPKGAPEDWQVIVDKAVTDIENASGFVFADRGTTSKTTLIGSRYAGNEWEPVLIMWSDRYQNQSLDGGVIGRGGSGSIDVNGTLRYVVGQASLDANVEDPFETQMVLEHELGHVLGLDHTGNPSQLMYSAYHGQKGLGKGDKAGLQRLHDVPCG